jgi:16S rRNA (adenine1518-N6/adenine1519-N6)-dimethyltransferase
MEKKKSLGQHFLKSKSALDRILDESDITPDAIVLEIGPGEGVLTQELVKLAGKVIAVEKDRRLIPYLKEKFAKEISAGKLELMEKDILEFDPDILSFYKHPYKVVANIPYYITGQILRMFLESSCQPESMTLLVQKEVAERIVAKDGKESLLSISVKAYGEPRYAATIPRGAFVPHPAVDSAILVIDDISKERLRDIDEKKFWKILHLGFAHKRKQLLPNLTSEYGRKKLIEIFGKLGINEKIRAEELPFEKWVKISLAIICD